MRARLLLLGGQTIALGLTSAFLVVPVSAIFLNEYGARALPYAYLAVAVAGLAVSWAMSRAERRLALASLAVTVLGAYLLLVAAGWAALVVADWLSVDERTGQVQVDADGNALADGSLRGLVAYAAAPFLLDGLVRVSRGQKAWTALVEVKTITNDLGRVAQQVA